MREGGTNAGTGFSAGDRGFGFLHELLLPWQWLGAVLILGAVILFSVDRKPDEPTPER